MFARYVSHRASRRSCACSPCPKEGTRATESKSCWATKTDGKAGSNSAPGGTDRMGQLTCCSTKAYWCSETVYWSKGSKSCHKETPLLHEDYWWSGQSSSRCQNFQHHGCRQWFLAAKVRWRVFTSVYIQHSHWTVQIYKATLWSEMRPWNISKDHGSNGWRFGGCGGHNGWCRCGRRRNNTWRTVAEIPG